MPQHFSPGVYIDKWVLEAVESPQGKRGRCCILSLEAKPVRTKGNQTGQQKYHRCDHLHIAPSPLPSLSRTAAITSHLISQPPVWCPDLPSPLHFAARVLYSESPLSLPCVSLNSLTRYLRLNILTPN